MPAVKIKGRFARYSTSRDFSPRWHWLAFPVFVLAPGESAFASSETEKQLRQEVNQLRELVLKLTSKLEKLESRLDSQNALQLAPARPGIAPAPNEAYVHQGDIPHSFKLPGTDTSIAVGGMLHADAIYNSTSVSGQGGSNIGDQMLLASTIPLDDSQGEDSQMTAHARKSRLWLKAYTPTDWGELSGLIEMDFFSTQISGDERVSNSYTPRMRHAYGRFGNFLAGQTWTTFMPEYALPELSDLGGPVGRILVRQPQLRWTRQTSLWSHPFEWEVAVEKAETTLTMTSGDRDTEDDDTMPDMVTRFNIEREWGRLSLAGMVRNIRRDDESKDSAVGGAISFGGKIKTFQEDDLRWMMSYGNALGRYVSNNFINDGALDENGEIELFEVYSGYAAYRHHWASGWRSNLVYGFTYANNVDFVAGETNKLAQSAQINLLWSPLLQLDIGVEYTYAMRELENGDDGNLHRIQFSSAFRF